MSEEDKYNGIIKILRESKPELTGKDEIANNVLQRIMENEKRKGFSVNFLDILFRWVYIGWVRRSLITASIFIIVIFTYQQSLILKRINSLEERTILTGSKYVNEEFSGLGKRMFIYKLSGRKTEPHGITISEKQIQLLMNSFNDLRDQYEDLIKIIEEDPELKKIIETKLSEKNKRKFNL